MEGQPSYQQIRIFHILAAPLSADLGEVTAGGKTRRQRVIERHQEAIDALYRRHR